MQENWKHILSVTLVLLFGCILFYLGTDGFRAFTAEAARVNQLIAETPQFPDVTLEDSNGRVYPFAALKGKYILATFIYTSCGTVCPRMEMNMAEVYRLIPEQYFGRDLMFLSISFDPTRDDPATLDKYRKIFGSDGETWRMARVPDDAELAALLKEFGVIAIPDEYGNFTHNTAFYLIDRNGRLIDVMDFTKIDEAAHKVINVLAQGGAHS